MAAFVLIIVFRVSFGVAAVSLPYYMTKAECDVAASGATAHDIYGGGTVVEAFCLPLKKQ